MARTFIPVRGAEDRAGFIPLEEITYISACPKDGGGYDHAWTKDGARHTLLKGWRDPANHLHLGEAT